LSGTRDTGSDIVATVNGYDANGVGNTISLNNSALNLNLTVSDGSTTDVAFDITGGGANFQLGPDVVTAQQARIGISSVNTGELGGVAGRLYELRSGNAKSLDNDATGAADVVDEVITKVNSLRGRLGAFQRTTLETNIANLNDTLANLTEAQSSIRDADFAVESANLTRAQILVQSGTAVLQIANQNPQNVLSLLRG
jgi:flagellin